MSENNKQYDEEGRVIRENRSALKRERAQIKTFAAQLLQLPARQYALLPISDTLAAALNEGKRLSGNALKRHMGYLTRLLEEHDLPALHHAHEHINHPYLNSDGKQRRIARETERLLDGDPDILGELLARYEDLDLQHLRQLVREAQKQRAYAAEMAQNTSAESEKNAKADRLRRKILHYLQGLVLKQ